MSQLLLVGGGLLIILVAGIAYYFLLFATKRSSKTSISEKGKTLVDPMMVFMQNSGTAKDPTQSIEAHLARTLRPNSDHWDVLVAILSSPIMIQWSVYDQQRVELALEKRKQELEEEKTKPANVVNDMDDLVNLGGWDDEEDNNDQDETLDEQRKEQDEREMAAKKAEDDRKRLMEKLKAATGKATVPMEAIDEGVIGQKWVESKLQQVNVWPPKSLSYFESKTYDYPPLEKVLSPLDHPGIRRMLCITLGRLHSSVLNSHPELIAASSQKKLDETYFRAASEARQRVIMLLNGALKVAAELGHPKLCQTVIETIAHFKVGFHPKAESTMAWFNEIMDKTYGMKPKLQLRKKELREQIEGDSKGVGPLIPPDAVLPCNSQVILLIEVERMHAEAFLRQKLALCQQQGINPQEGLKAFREQWWFLVDGPKSIRDNNDNNTSTWPPNSIKSYKVPTDHLALFESDSERVLIQITPMIIPNISQKQLLVRVGLKTPSQPGTYKLEASLYSAEFLGADITDITFELQCEAHTSTDDTKKDN